ncbi:MAG: DUF4870 domain-containing protein [Pirellula sp.]|jgi:uncharacterized Tic20 family protein
MNGRNWAMLIHFSVFAGYVVPFAGLIAPILIWQLKKEEFPEIDAHGKEVLNFLLCMFIYGAIAGLLVFLLIGIPILMALGVLAVVFPIIGGIKANEGTFWKYPLMLRLLND